LIKELFYKWFGITEPQCEVCEVLMSQLAKSELERQDLLRRLLDPVKAEPPQQIEEEFKPITPLHTPWRVKREMLEAEDRHQAKLIRDKAKEIEELEKEMGVK
jgi:hypothetical protein